VPAAAYRGGTDVLAVRYAGESLGAVAAGTTMLRANRGGGALYIAGAGAPPDLGPEAKDHALQARIYWVGSGADGEPAMYLGQLEVVSGAPRLVEYELASGVEDFQFELGVDSDRDGVVDGFRSADELDPWDPTMVRAVKLWILVKSVGGPVGEFDDKEYRYAGKTFVSNDGSYRYLYTTTVLRRNRG
jgi:hypothetical protein